MYHLTYIIMFQLKKMNRKDLKLHSKSWVNPKIQRLIKYRDQLHRKQNWNFYIILSTCTKRLLIE